MNSQFGSLSLGGSCSLIVLRFLRIFAAIFPITHSLMVRWFLCLFAFLSLSGCELKYLILPYPPPNYGAGDYAVARARPYPQEELLAEKRLANFVRRANSRQLQVLSANPIVAVQAYELPASGDFYLSRQLAGGRVQAVALYSRGIYARGETPVKFLLLFDSRTGKLVKPDGVLVIDTPNRGHLGRFGGINAIYAGTGFW
jgi:hypothetical protein